MEEKKAAGEIRQLGFSYHCSHSEAGRPIGLFCFLGISLIVGSTGDDDGIVRHPYPKRPSDSTPTLCPPLVCRVRKKQLYAVIESIIIKIVLN